MWMLEEFGFPLGISYIADAMLLLWTRSLTKMRDLLQKKRLIFFSDALRKGTEFWRVPACVGGRL